MPEDRIIIKSHLASQVKLPGTITLPDGKERIRLGSGEIMSLINSGGMAIVYEIWNPELEVKRAVKLLHPDHSRESEERFYTEMKITAKLHHANIVEIYGVGRWNGLPFIEMERIDGSTLQQILSRLGSLPPKVCTAAGIMVGRALNYAHNQTYILYGKEYKGIIHRDLKPGNIMLTREGNVKLMDFGIARPMSASIHTSEGTVVGTMQYLAPEQLDGSMTDVRSDVYSLGTVLYEILTGVRTFPETSITKLVPDKLANNFVSLDDFSLKVPQALVNLIHKCLRFEKEKRIQNMKEFLRSLGAIHKSLTPLSPEQVMTEFVRTAKRAKTVARARKRARKLPRLLAGGAMALAVVALGSAALLGLSLNLPLPGFRANGSDVLPAEMALVHAERQLAPPPEVFVEEDAMVEETATPKPIAPSRRKPRTARTRRPAPSAKRPAATVTKINATSPEPSAVTPKPAQAATGSSGLVGKLSARYGTTDAMVLYTGEVERGNYSNALELYGQLPAQQATSKKAVIYRLRAAEGAGDKATVRKILTGQQIHDGEFYVEKSQYYFGRGDAARALAVLNKAETAPSEYMDQKTFRQRLLYGKALCASATFDAGPNAQSKREAMTAWYEVKSLLRTAPQHPYFKKADEEIRRVNSNAADN